VARQGGTLKTKAANAIVAGATPRPQRALHPVGTVDHELRGFRVKAQIMACVPSWDVLAILCGFPDSETMLTPYLLWSAAKVRLEPITDARLGFAPLASRHRLWHGQGPSVDPALVDAAALQRLDALPSADRALRTAAGRFVEHVVAVPNGKDVWSNTYNPLSMRADIGSLSGASFLQPRRTLVDGLAPVLSSYLKQLRLPSRRTPPTLCVPPSRRKGPYRQTPLSGWWPA